MCQKNKPVEIISLAMGIKTSYNWMCTFVPVSVDKMWITLQDPIFFRIYFRKACFCLKQIVN